MFYRLSSEKNLLGQSLHLVTEISQAFKTRVEVKGGWAVV